MKFTDLEIVGLSSCGGLCYRLQLTTMKLCLLFSTLNRLNGILEIAAYEELASS